MVSVTCILKVFTEIALIIQPQEIVSCYNLEYKSSHFHLSRLFIGKQDHEFKIFQL